VQAARTLPTVVYMAGPRLSVLLFLLVQPAVLAGVQVGLCYCNVGVCYKSAGELCLSDEDFYGEGGSKETWCQAHPEDRICKPKEL